MHQIRREKRTRILFTLLLSVHYWDFEHDFVLAYTEFDCAALLAML